MTIPICRYCGSYVGLDEYSSHTGVFYPTHNVCVSPAETGRWMTVSEFDYILGRPGIRYLTYDRAREIASQFSWYGRTGEVFHVIDLDTSEVVASVADRVGRPVTGPPWVAD